MSKDNKPFNQGQPRTEKVAAPTPKEGAVSAKIATSSGEVAEWSNVPDSKSGVRFSRTVGSNPTLSAITPFTPHDSTTYHPQSTTVFPF